jgi:CRISPR-associated endonuclease/helicase Cas3
VLTDGWPATIDVPTGLGKTSILDVAVFAAALRPGTAARRMFFVVDRRIVVDEAHQHALRIRDALRDGTDNVVRAVASALRQPGDDGPGGGPDNGPGGGPIEVTRMRGGVTWDARWVQRPDRFAIVTGTVDQVGSRLLFRGYGVSERARSIDAALVGTDSLIVIDEAHLAAPFLTTITDLGNLDPHPIGRRPVLVTMSATTKPGTADTVHTISAEDEADPIAGLRLRARKRIHLVEVKTTRSNADMAMADALAATAMRLAPSGVVGVVVNTVARARAVFDRLTGQVDTQVEATLLIGRSRPVDREYLLAEWLPRIGVERAKPPPAPTVIVATQTVEVGANIDLDALVTESAPWDSLVQRLGRLNRLGDADDAAAVVLHPTSTDSDDPVYGTARLATWRWLATRTEPTPYTSRLDPAQLGTGMPASPLALRYLARRTPHDATTVPPAPPVIDESVLNAWARTSPSPVPDPPIEPFLHGRRDVLPGVQVVWRADLPDDPQAWKAAIDQVPPVAEEAVEVPIRAVRRWLHGQRPDPTVSDHDAAPAPELDEPDGPSEPRPVLRYRGSTDGQIVPPGRVRPGDLIVVPTSYGGCDPYGWNPLSSRPVTDVADLASRRGRPLLRVSNRLSAILDWYHPDLTATPGWAALQQARDDTIQLDVVHPDSYRKALTTLHDAIPPDGRRLPLARNLARLNRPGLKATPLANGDVLLTTGHALGDDDTANASSVGNNTRPIELDPHQRAVAHRAAEFARNLGLPRDLVHAVAQAARWHDEGKRDPRFQTMLWAGDPLRADLATQPLAKSGMNLTDRAALRRAQRRSGYPPGLRHEALSARIAALRLDDNNTPVDRDLVIHLVTSHHGCGRPLLPAVLDPSPRHITVNGLDIPPGDAVDWAGPARFARLNNQYGRWGLALLETLVRLADIWCSARNEEKQDEYE